MDTRPISIVILDRNLPANLPGSHTASFLLQDVERTPMDESIDWRALLYPGEWAFRLFVAALIVWLVGPRVDQPDHRCGLLCVDRGGCRDSGASGMGTAAVCPARE